MTRIFILEDQPDARVLLEGAVAQTFADAQVTQSDSLAAAAGYTETPFDYVLADLRLPDGLSLPWITAFKTAQPATPVVVTSLYDEDDLVFAALRAGADGYLLKGDGHASLVASLQRVLQGEPPISPAIARKLMQQFRGGTQAAATPTQSPASAPAASPVTESLTKREDEVLALIGSGMLIKQAAAKLGLSPHTVNDNIKAIYRKLGIHTRAQAAMEAAKRGLTAR
jgi:two-component system, NarL family, nitrate/nitrite response regulator NarL